MLPPPTEALPEEQPHAVAEGSLWAGPRVVALGGGTGLPVLLRGLKACLVPGTGAALSGDERDRLTAIVTVADDGGSSGRLRRDYGMLPPGDIRNCLLALTDGEGTLADLFGFRFNGRGEIAGHNLGNLILAALGQMESRFERAVERAGDILGVCGRVLPASTKRVTLVAEFEDGSRVEGESRIADAGRRIRRVHLEPSHAQALPQALEAISAADCVVIGPGSLYTSLIPVLLVEGLADAIFASGARVVLVMNLMTEPGETDGLTAPDHLLALCAHVRRLPVHDVILNDAAIPEDLRLHYAAEGARPVAPQADALRGLGCGTWTGDLLASGGKVRHDGQKLARAVLELAGQTRLPKGGRV
jgi:uncharacterized cofD-like protein